MNPKIYDIDHQKLITWLIPEELRKPLFISFLSAVLFPVVAIYQLFMLFKDAKVYQLKITPQVCYLERLLNDRYDSVSRRIYITDGVDKPPTYIYKSVELKPLFIFRRSEGKPRRAIYTRGESGDLKDDFIVWVPMEIVFELAEMISLVRGFKLAGTKFKIQRF